MKLRLETAGTSLQSVMKCSICCTSAKHFPVVNAIYARYFPEKSARLAQRLPHVSAFTDTATTRSMIPEV
jgi:enamine deaminase RidA (YjgF/YER057c/UK114 family)